MEGEVREPDNAVAEAMRKLAEMRGTNAQLRAEAPREEDVPPLTDEEAAEEFRRSTGLIVDPTTGNVVGKDPNWTGPDPFARREPAPLEDEDELPPPTKEEPGKDAGPRNWAPMAPRGMLNGIDLDLSVAVLDGVEYPISPKERGAVGLLVLDAMAKAVQMILDEKRKAYLEGMGNGGDEAVPEVSEGPPAGGVPAEQGGEERPPAVVPGVPAGAPEPQRPRRRRKTPAPARGRE